MQAAATALKRLATDARCIGTALPGCPGVLPPWGRQRQSHPPIHAIVPGGGRAEDRTTWRPSSATCLAPVTALSPLSRALLQEDMRHAGLLEPLHPQVWTIPWNVQSQATHHGHSACTSLAPSGCRGALSNPRRVSLTDRMVPFASRTPARTRPRPTTLDVMQQFPLIALKSLPSMATA